MSEIDSGNEREVDAEAGALYSMFRAFQPLTEDARVRVLNYICRRFGLPTENLKEMNIRLEKLISAEEEIFGLSRVAISETLRAARERGVPIATLTKHMDEWVKSQPIE